jgi:hypothetical protein
MRVRTALAFAVVGAAFLVGGVSNPQAFSMLLRAVLGAL